MDSLTLAFESIAIFLTLPAFVGWRIANRQQTGSKGNKKGGES